jgi:hypothetical protein
MYVAAIRQMTKMLSNLRTFLQEGADCAQAADYPVDRLLDARLAPDMFHLTRQVQAACDAIKFAAARISGTEPPKNPDEETTLEELFERIDGTLAFVNSIGAAAYDGVDDRTLELNFMPGPVPASAYFLQFAQPNFYFHTTTAYAILRHNGVKLGKRTYLGEFD